MKYYVPEYYSLFKCTASLCAHTCCRGWEIDIDDDAMRRFGSVTGPFGERIRSSIAVSPEGASFVLKEDESCPFLRTDGLCDMILALGEDSLCQICRDHPRFRSFFGAREETGLGLCCEAAAELILNYPHAPALILTNDDGYEDGPCDGEEELLSRRASLMQNMPERMEIDYAEAKKLLLGLERLDDKWTEMLSCLISEEKCDVPASKLQRLWEYLLFHHLPEALDSDFSIEEHEKFCRFSLEIIRKIAASSGLSLEETARIWSSEIEYSDENISIIMDALKPLSQLR